MNIEFSERVREVITLSVQEARRLGHNYLGTEHLILGIIKEGEGLAVNLLKELGLDLNEVVLMIEDVTKNTADHSPKNLGNASPTKQSRKVFKITSLEAKNFKSSSVRTEHLLLSILKEKNNLASQILSKFNVNYQSIKDLLEEKEGFISSSGIEQGDSSRMFRKESPIRSKHKSRSSEKFKTPILDEFGTDLTLIAEQGNLDPIIGREKEIERVAQILSRRRKNNPILIGEPGVGKTAIAEGLALKIIQKKVSRILFEKRIVTLDLASLVAGTKYRGQFEERIKAIMNELEKAKNIIVLIDEVHTIVGAGGASGSLDASNIFKPALSRGDIQCIGATTLDKYRQYIEKDGALARRFQVVMVDPTSIVETIKILNNIKGKYEQHHHVHYEDEAINACVTLSERYISNRFFPDKAIDIMDEAGAKVHINNIYVPDHILKLEKGIEYIKEEKNRVVRRQKYEEAAKLRDKEKALFLQLQEAQIEWEKKMQKEVYPVREKNITEVITMITGIPVNKLIQKESEKLIAMEEELKKKVIGQDEAIRKLTRAIQRTRVGLKDPSRPIGTFIFLGPTGVGKTELAKMLSHFLFDKEDMLIRIDMSEYMEKFSISRLIGAPPGYIGYEEGGQLTEKIIRKPYSVILLDEIEKAHPDIFNILLQVMDDGILTDSLGRKVDFKNTIIIMTSNIGAKELKDFGTGIGFISQSKKKHQNDLVKSTIQNELRKTFSPEFLNRLDDVIIFNALEREHIHQIIDISLDKLFKRTKDMGYTIQLTPAAKDFIADKGYDPQYGARPLNRAIQKYLEDLIAEELLKNETKEGNILYIDYEKGSETLIVKSERETISQSKK